MSLLTERIEEGDNDGALRAIKRGREDFYSLRAALILLFNAEQKSEEVISAVFEALLESPGDREYAWLECIIPISGLLWRHQRTDLVKKLMQRAFSLNQYVSSYDKAVLISVFMKYSSWSDDPKDFHLTEEVLKNAQIVPVDARTWKGWHPEFDFPWWKVRIEHGPFASESEMRKEELICKLFSHPFQKMDLSYTVDVTAVNDAIAELETLGGDSSQFTGRCRALLDQQLIDQENQLLRISNGSIIALLSTDGQRDEIRKAIEKTKAELAEC